MLASYRQEQAITSGGRGRTRGRGRDGEIVALTRARGLYGAFVGPLEAVWTL